MINMIITWRAIPLLGIYNDSSPYNLAILHGKVAPNTSSCMQICASIFGLFTNQFLGVDCNLWQSMTLDSHVNRICKCAWFRLHQICRIKEYLTTYQLKVAIHAYVTSVLDQNNCLLKGLPKTSLHKLTQVQHAAAREIVGTKKHDHITHQLKHLHCYLFQNWL